MLIAELPPKSRHLIVSNEGLNQPGKWPGASSGITIGWGYDLGYCTVNEFEADWGELLSPSVMLRLRAVVGMRAAKASNRAAGLADIRCTNAQAEQVFLRRTVPKIIFETARTYPGLDRLPAEVQGTLVSLIYNRGTSLFDKPGSDRRLEMRVIRDLVRAGDLQGIADQLRSMKRLWVGKGVDGLIRRREEEARLVESCIV